MNAAESGPSSTRKPDVSSEFTLEMEQTEDYEFRVRFEREQFGPLTMDEPTPLGKGRGPSASRFVAAAVGHCLSASLLFCSRKGRIAIGPIHTRVRAQLRRNERGRWRVTKMNVEIDPHIPEPDRENAIRCLDLFEDYCVVTQSVRQGIPVEVTVKGLEGLRTPAKR
jgi:uncharacterized OsmC-like protein